VPSRTYTRTTHVRKDKKKNKLTVLLPLSTDVNAEEDKKVEVRVWLRGFFWLDYFVNL
jgi:hypothetical protein